MTRLNAILPCLTLLLLPAISASTNGPVDAQLLTSTTIANVPLLVSVPRRITRHTPLVILYHGFGIPNTPESLARALPPMLDAVTVYPTLPLTGTRMPAGGVDELIRRQKADYIGQLLYPSILGAAQELPRIIEGVSKAYGLSKAAPIVLFGFSAGGAAALLSLTETGVHPLAVVVVNSPLSVIQAAESYERQTKNVYEWTAEAKIASAEYDIEKNARRICKSNPKTAILILESEHDAGPTVADAEAAALALNNACLAYDPSPDISAQVLAGSNHNVLNESEISTVRSKILDWIGLHSLDTRHRVGDFRQVSERKRVRPRTRRLATI